MIKCHSIEYLVKRHTLTPRLNFSSQLDQIITVYHLDQLVGIKELETLEENRIKTNKQLIKILSIILSGYLLIGLMMFLVISETPVIVGLGVFSILTAILLAMNAQYTASLSLLFRDGTSVTLTASREGLSDLLSAYSEIIQLGTTRKAPRELRTLSYREKNWIERSKRTFVLIISFAISFCGTLIGLSFINQSYVEINDYDKLAASLCAGVLISFVSWMIFRAIRN